MRRITSVLFLYSVFAMCLLANDYDFIVAQDGSGQYKTLQEAINAVPDFRKTETIIFIKNGTYKEKIVLPRSKRQITLIGEDQFKTIITYDDYANKLNSFGEKMGTTGSSSFYVFGEQFTAINITFSNTAGDVGQAVAMRVSTDKSVFYKCRFIGCQDTLYPKKDGTRQYFKECYIEGTVDFIFGWSTAVFEECEIFCKKKGYITAASTNQDQEYGFVFYKCKITGSAEENTFYLGRPWRPYSKTVFVKCWMGKHIRPQGWDNWDKPEAEKTVFYAEYKSKGPGGDIVNRVEWSKQLLKQNWEKYLPENVLKGDDDWDYKAVINENK